MLAHLASAAIGGFGASFGRDLYRSARKNPILFAVVGALLLCFGWRNVFLGTGRGALYFIFVTCIGSALMIALGSAMVYLVAIYIGGIAFGGMDTPGPHLLAIAGVVLLSLVGMWWGRRDAGARADAAEVERQNLAFLAEAGLRDSGFETDTLRDEEGNTLKLIEQADDRIVFSVAGRRGLRAAIKLEAGRMVSYSGIVAMA